MAAAARDSDDDRACPECCSTSCGGCATDGYATEIEETTAGYCSVAVPIFGASGMLLAVAVADDPGRPVERGARTQRCCAR